MIHMEISALTVMLWLNCVMIWMFIADWTYGVYLKGERADNQ